MKKSLNTQQIVELNFLCDVIVMIAKYCNEKNIFDFSLLIEDTEKARKMGLLKGAKMAIVDLIDILSDVANSELEELNRRLKERFGKTLYDFQKNTDKKIAQIIKRRKIRNEEEFRLAQMHIDRIFQDTEKEEEWKILEDLCFEFEQSVEVS